MADNLVAEMSILFSLIKSDILLLRMIEIFMGIFISSYYIGYTSLLLICLGFSMKTRLIFSSK